MTATLREAKDAIAAHLKAAWDAGAATSGVALLWEGVDDDPPADAVPWARVSFRHATGEQTSIGGATGKQRFRTDGTVTVQCFGLWGDGGDQAYSLAEVVQAAFRDQGAGSGIWFRDAAPREVGKDAYWFQVNVSAGFVYEEIR